MNITVYLGANLGTDPALPQAVQQLGRWIGESGNALVYGGSKSGLMGLLADSVLAAGGRVTGVEPKCFLDAELQHEGLTELIVTEDIPADAMAIGRSRQHPRPQDQNDRAGGCFYRVSRRHRHAGGDHRGHQQAVSGTAEHALHPLRPERLLPASAPAFAADDYHGAFYSGAAAEYRLCCRP